LTFIASSVDPNQFYYTPLPTPGNNSTTDGNDAAIVAATATAAGVSLVAVVVAVVVTAILMVCCGVFIMFIWYRKFRVHPEKEVKKTTTLQYDEEHPSGTNLMK
jgi:Flp pilus assembly protein TadB